MDYLRTYPVAARPETWPINDECLDAVARLRDMWAEKGYEWRFGQEFEFSVLTVGMLEDRPLLNKGLLAADIKILSPSLAPSLALHEHLIQKTFHVDDIIGRVEALKHYASGSSEIADMAECLSMTMADIQHTLSDYIHKLQSDDAGAANDARINAYLAWLHLMPPEKDGLRGIILPRFGSYAFGNGWWDYPGNVEVRTHVREDIDFIVQSHQILELVFRSAVLFHVIPRFDQPGNHLHGSLWCKKSGRNIMRLSSDQDKELAMGMMSGLANMLYDAPHIFTDFDPQDPNYNLTFSTGSSRRNLIRQTPETWELRRDYNSGLPHTARDIVAFMGGAYHGAFMPHDNSAALSENDIKIDFVEKPVVALRWGYTATSMQRAIENASIADDGTLDVTSNSMFFLQVDLLKEIGDVHRNAFQVTTERSGTQGLDRIETWIELFKSIRLDENNVLHYQHLSPELHVFFDQLEVTGRRPYLSGIGDRNVSSQLDLKRMAHVLAHTPVISTIFNASAIPTVCQHFVNAAETSFARLGEIMAKRHFGIISEIKAIENGERGENVEALPEREAMIQDIWAELFFPQLAEITTEPKKAKGRQRAETHQHYQEADIFIKAVLPHFKAALDGRMNELRASPVPDNRALSYLQDLKEFLDDGVLDFRHYQSHLSKAIMKVVSTLIWNGESDNNIAFSAIALAILKLNAGFMVTLTDPKMTEARAEECLKAVREAFAKSIDNEIDRYEEVYEIISRYLEQNKLPPASENIEDVREFIKQKGLSGYFKLATRADLDTSVENIKRSASILRMVRPDMIGYFDISAQNLQQAFKPV